MTAAIDEECVEEVRSRAAAAPLGSRQQVPVGGIVLAYITCALIWGTTWYAIRVCIAPGAYPTYPAAALRFSIAALVLGAIWLFRRKQIKKPTAGELMWITVAGLLGGTASCLQYTAEEHIAGGLAAVISATQPMFAAAIALCTGTESLRKTTILGSILSVAGVCLVFHDRMQVSQQQAFAIGTMVIYCFFASSTNVAMKRHASKTSPLAANTIFFASASILLWIVTALTGQLSIPPAPPLASTWALLYLVLFGTLLVFSAFFYLLKHVRLSTAMTLAFVTPLIALFIDALFEKHSVLTIESYVGIGVVLIGVAVSVRIKNAVKAH